MGANSCRVRLRRGNWKEKDRIYASDRCHPLGLKEKIGVTAPVWREKIYVMQIGGNGAYFSLQKGGGGKDADKGSGTWLHLC